MRKLIHKIRPQAGTKLPAASVSKPASLPSTASSQTAIAPITSPSSSTLAASRPDDCTQRILDAAVGKIADPKHRAAVEDFIKSTNISDGFVEEAQRSLEQLETSCATHRWSFEIQGHAISPGEVARGLSKMFRLAKPLLDTVAAMEPLYAGLPIAAINAMFGVVDLTNSQTQLLLTGLQTSVFMLHQLVLYRDYLQQLQSGGTAVVGAIARTAEKGLEDALSDAYAHTLTFLIIGQDSVQRNGIRRTIKLLFNQEMNSQFQATSDRDCSRLEQTAQQCSRKHSDDRLDEIRRQTEQMKKLEPIMQLLENVNVKLDLNRLQYASSAAYDVVDAPKEGTLESYCLAGTRETLIEEIMSWCSQSQENMYWLRGMAGTGKSTLIRTVARKLDDKNLLAGSFFFRQDTAAQKDGTFFVQTIVRQLLTKHRLLRPHIAAALDDDLTLPGGAISNRFAKLLREPLLRDGMQRMIIVVDALDECEPRDARAIIKQLAELALAVKFKVLVTSRPEEHLLAEFRTILPAFSRLEDIKQEQTEADLRLFIEHRTALMVAEDAGRDFQLLPAGWPDRTALDRLVLLSKPLFIFAATLIRYISEQTYEPAKVLANILDDSSFTNESASTGHTQLEKLEPVYLPILNSIHGAKGPQFLEVFHHVVGAIVLLQDPLSVHSLATLMHESLGKIFSIINQLQSVLYVPAQSKDGAETPVRALHKSFRDFLLESDHKYKIDQVQTHGNLLEYCLRLMIRRLHRDLCEVVAPGTKRMHNDRARHPITRDHSHNLSTSLLPSILPPMPKRTRGGRSRTNPTTSEPFKWKNGIYSRK